MRHGNTLNRDRSAFQFTLRIVTIVMYGLAVFLAICRRVLHPGVDGGQLTLTIGLALYLGGCVALWADRVSVAIALMLGGLAMLLVGAIQCGGFR